MTNSFLYHYNPLIIKNNLFIKEYTVLSINTL